jgi:glycosyltransferase involved in cell wall biosynthesis
LIIVQNLPVPFDRRVWLECGALTRAGYRVAVVCPKGKGDAGYQELQGVELYKYDPRAFGPGAVGYLTEYLYAFVATLYLALKASRRGRFAAVQSCNPPDIFWPIGALFRLIHGSRFVFDHHDLCPETYEVRFPTGSRTVYRVLRLLERCTMRTADHVIATNESFRDLVMRRDSVPADQVTVVRTGPDPKKLTPVSPKPELRRGRKYLVAYIGVMGPQDGVDNVVKMADIVVNRYGRDDVSFTIIGSGDCFDDLVALRDRYQLGDFVDFVGRIPDDEVASILSTADVGVSPDPKNALNDVSTMNKTMEYMAFRLPVLAFDLHETRVSAGDAALYASANDVDHLAGLLLALLDDESRRHAMGAYGRDRIERQLAWEHQAPIYQGVYDGLLGTKSASLPALPRAS